MTIPGYVWLIIIVNIAALAYFWSSRKSATAPASNRDAIDNERARANAAEERARKSESNAKAAVAELNALKNRPEDRSEIEKATRELAAEREKNGSLTIQLKKAREAQNASEARIAEAGKGAQAKVFELQNEIAKAREEASRATQFAATAEQEIAKAKSAVSADAGEVKELGNQVIALRKEASSATKAAEDAKSARDAAQAELTAAKDKAAKLEEELAQTKTRPGVAAVVASAATTVVAAAAAPRGVSEEQFNAVRSALSSAQQERDAASTALEAAEAEASELRQKTDALQAELASLKSGSADACTSTQATTSLAEAGSAMGVIDAAATESAATVVAALAQQLEAIKAERDGLASVVAELKKPDEELPA